MIVGLLAPYGKLVGAWHDADSLEVWLPAHDVLFGVTFEGTATTTAVHVQRLSATDDHVDVVLLETPAAVIPLPTRPKTRGLHKAHPPPAPELEAADRAFELAVASGGIDAWIAAFDPVVGHQWDDHAGEIPVGDAMRAATGPILTDGKLVWTPTSSLLAPAGDAGLTTGTWTWTDGSRTAEGAYLTIWKRQSDGTWKVWFDTGS
jgi:hypothetical protein